MNVIFVNYIKKKSYHFTQFHQKQVVCKKSENIRKHVKNETEGKNGTKFLNRKLIQKLKNYA